MQKTPFLAHFTHLEAKNNFENFFIPRSVIVPKLKKNFAMKFPAKKLLNPFVPNAPFLYHLQTSENSNVF